MGTRLVSSPACKGLRNGQSVIKISKKTKCWKINYSQTTAPQNGDRKAEPENHNLSELKPIHWNLCRNQCWEWVNSELQMDNCWRLSVDKKRPCKTLGGPRHHGFSTRLWVLPPGAQLGSQWLPEKRLPGTFNRRKGKGTKLKCTRAPSSASEEIIS